MTRRRLRIERSSLLLIAGLGGLAYETIANGAEKPVLIMAFLSLIFGTPFLPSNFDIRRKDDRDEEKR